MKRVGTIYLNKEDSENFIRSLLFPSKEEMEKRRRRLKEMQKYKIQNTENGFYVEIEDIDISDVGI